MRFCIYFLLLFCHNLFWKFVCTWKFFSAKMVMKTHWKWQYSGTCTIRHLSFPISCDIREKFMVPKYFC